MAFKEKSMLYLELLLLCVPLTSPFTPLSVLSIGCVHLTACVLISCNAAIYGFYSYVNSRIHISDTIYDFYLSGVKNWR